MQRLIAIDGKMSFQLPKPMKTFDCCMTARDGLPSTTLT